MTAPAVSWGLFGRGAHEAGRVRVPEQAGPERVLGEDAGPPEPVAATATATVPVPVESLGAGAGPAERALLEASRELGGLHPLDRAEYAALSTGSQAPSVEPTAEPTAEPPAEPPAEPIARGGAPVPADVPQAAPPVLDVLPTGRRSRRSARDAVLPLVLLGELLTGVWLGTVKPWQGDAPDPLQARFSSTAPASDDLRLPEAVPPAVPPAGQGGTVLWGTAPQPTAPTAATPEAPTPAPTQVPERAVDPFRPR